MTLDAKIGGFMDFLAISGCDTNLYHSQGVATELSLCDPDRREGVNDSTIIWVSIKCYGCFYHLTQSTWRKVIRR